MLARKERVQEDNIWELRLILVSKLANEWTPIGGYIGKGKEKVDVSYHNTLRSRRGMKMIDHKPEIAAL